MSNSTKWKQKLPIISATAVAGGLGGLGYSLLRKRNKKTTARNILLGSLLLPSGYLAYQGFQHKDSPINKSNNNPILDQPKLVVDNQEDFSFAKNATDPIEGYTYTGLSEKELESLADVWDKAINQDRKIEAYNKETLAGADKFYRKADEYDNVHRNYTEDALWDRNYEWLKQQNPDFTLDQAKFMKEHGQIPDVLPTRLVMEEDIMPDGSSSGPLTDTYNVILHPDLVDNDTILPDLPKLSKPPAIPEEDKKIRAEAKREFDAKVALASRLFNEEIALSPGKANTVVHTNNPNYIPASAMLKAFSSLPVDQQNKIWLAYYMLEDEARKQQLEERYSRNPYITGYAEDGRRYVFPIDASDTDEHGFLRFDSEHAKYLDEWNRLRSEHENRRRESLNMLVAQMGLGPNWKNYNPRKELLALRSRRKDPERLAESKDKNTEPRANSVSLTRPGSVLPIQTILSILNSPLIVS